MAGNPPIDHLSEISKRKGIIKALLTGVDDRQELVENVSVSRMTVDRALKDLEDLNVVTSVGSDYKMTPFGRHTFRRFENLVRDYEYLESVQDLLDLLPEDYLLNLSPIVGAEVTRASMSAPQRPNYHLLSMVRSGSDVSLLTPVVDLHLLEALRKRSVEKQKASTILLEEQLAEYLWSEQGSLWKPFVTSRKATVWQTPSKPPYALLVADEEILLGFFDDHGALKATIKNDTNEAISWAESEFEKFIDGGKEMILRSSSPVVEATEERSTAEG